MTRKTQKSAQAFWQGFTTKAASYFVGVTFRLNTFFRSTRNKMARFEVRPNNDLEGWDIIDTHSMTNPSGECRDTPEPHWVATFYDAILMHYFVTVANALSEGTSQTTKKGV